MNDRLNRALMAYIEKDDIEISSFKRVEISDNGCGEEPTLDLNYRAKNGLSRSWEIENYEVTDFLDFLVEFER